MDKTEATTSEALLYVADKRQLAVVLQGGSWSHHVPTNDTDNLKDDMYEV